MGGCVQSLGGVGGWVKGPMSCAGARGPKLLDWTRGPRRAVLSVARRQRDVKKLAQLKYWQRLVALWC